MTDPLTNDMRLPASMRVGEEDEGLVEELKRVHAAIY